MTSRLAPFLLAFLGVRCTQSSDSSRRAFVVELRNDTTRITVHASVGWPSGSAWALREVKRIGGGGSEDSVALGSPTSLAIDARGNVYIADQYMRLVYVYEPRRGVLRTIGQAGRGPGEFQQPTGITIDARQRLWVRDPALTRFSVFDTAGRLVRTGRRESFYWAYERLFADDAGLIYDVTKHFDDPLQQEVLVIHDTTNTVIDSFPLPHYRELVYEVKAPGGNTVTSYDVPFAPRVVWRVDRLGRLFWGTGERYEILISRPSDRAVTVIRRVVRPEAVTEAEGAAAVDAIRRVARKVDARVEISEEKIPKTKPAFNAFAIDDEGYLWVHVLRRKSKERSIFEVFSPDGALLGEVEASARLQARMPSFAVGGGYLAGAHIDSLGVSSVVVYAVRR